MTRRKTCGVLAFAVLAVSTTFAGAIASATTRANPAATKPDLGYFAGKTITFIGTASVGSSQEYDILAMQPYLQSYLHATVNIEYISSGGGVTGQDAIAAASPNGLTIGAASIGTDLNSILTGDDLLSFSLKKMSYIGATYSATDLVVACTGSPFSSFAQVLTAANPVTYINQVTTGANLLDRVLLKTFNIHNTLLNGYGSNSAAIQGCLRGDGQLTATGTSNFLTTSQNAVIPGVTPLLLTGSVPKGSAYDFLNSKVPTIASFAKAHPPKTALGAYGLKLLEGIYSQTSPQYVYAAPPGVPKNILLALQDAFAYAERQPAVRKTHIADGFPVGMYPGTKVIPYLDSVLNRFNTIQEFIHAG